MSKKGTLKFEDFGTTMPVTDPYVPGPPSFSRGESFRITFEMDYESVKHRLPEELEFLNDPPTGTLLCANAIFVSDATPFLEANLIYHVTYKGKPFNYITNVFLNEGEPLVAGREVYGYPKKLADMEFYWDKGQICMTVDRPRGFRIFSASVRTIAPKQPDPKDYRDVLLLKVIPSPIIGDPPQVCQLIGLPTNVGPEGLPKATPESFECSGTIAWGAVTAEDPWGETKITKILNAFYTKATGFGSLASGYIVHDYLK